MESKSFTRSITVTTSKSATQNIFIGAKGPDDEEQAEMIISDKVQKALKAGHQVTLEDGRKQWIEALQVIDTTKTGSDAYTWDRSGDKVLHERILFTLHVDKTTTRQVLGTSYRNPFS